MSEINDDVAWMNYAFKLAEKAEAQGEIPVGAVIVRDNQILGEGWNQPITENDPTAHAEIVALRAAGKATDNYRLVDSTLYVTLEPCPMCAGAIIHSRVDRVVFGALDYKTGAVESVMSLFEHSSNNHKVDYQGGVLAEQCSHQLSGFFQKRRAQKKLEKQLKQAAELNKKTP